MNKRGFAALSDNGILARATYFDQLCMPCDCLPFELFWSEVCLIVRSIYRTGPGQLVEKFLAILPTTHDSLSAV